MSKKLFKSLSVALTLLLLFSLPATALAASGKLTKTVDGTKVTLILPSEKGVIGDNDIKISLVNKKTKKVVTGSKVSIAVEMDSKSMGSMDMSEVQTVTFQEGKTKGEYSGTVNFTDEGDWKLKVSFTTGTGKYAKTHTTTFTVSAVKKSS